MPRHAVFATPPPCLSSRDPDDEPHDQSCAGQDQSRSQQVTTIRICEAVLYCYEGSPPLDLANRINQREIISHLFRMDPRNVIAEGTVIQKSASHSEQDAHDERAHLSVHSLVSPPKYPVTNVYGRLGSTLHGSGEVLRAAELGSERHVHGQFAPG